MQTTTHTTLLTETIPPQQLGDRIVVLLQERATYLQTRRPSYVTDASPCRVACQVFELALVLGESSESIHAALGHLHRAKRIQSFNVAVRDGSAIYCVALRD